MRGRGDLLAILVAAVALGCEPGVTSGPACEALSGARLDPTKEVDPDCRWGPVTPAHCDAHIDFTGPPTRLRFQAFWDDRATERIAGACVCDGNKLECRVGADAGPRAWETVDASWDGSRRVLTWRGVEYAKHER